MSPGFLPRIGPAGTPGTLGGRAWPLRDKVRAGARGHHLAGRA